MSRQKQNLLWLMIVCCASHQIRQCKCDNEGQYEVSIDEAFADIKMWLLLDVSSTPAAGFLKIPSVDPGEICSNATYDEDTCNWTEEGKYILHFNGSEWMCVICVNESSTADRPLSNTTTNNPTTSFEPTETTNDPTTSFEPTETTNDPTTSFEPTETTNNPTTSFEPFVTINNPKTSSTNNLTTSFKPTETTNNPNTVSNQLRQLTIQIPVSNHL
ncbi:uncharacterized protein LOC125269245 [Megalobrama amblycephala]|uniref:uncharacterized protein LOC125269245 n=1 Tax=Megalobrama amblycephala TaxID=75352 RepID=UPI0020142A30|nr:uncharacterized protein LOC125269245 [Megalobrama amblycephala]